MVNNLVVIQVKDRMAKRFLYLSLVVCRKISTFADKACKPNKKTNKYYNHSMIYVSL